MDKAVLLQSDITCPVCGHQEKETMPTDACQYFYENKFILPVASAGLPYRLPGTWY